MLASQVEVNADVVMISETKLDDTLPVDQFVLEGFSKPFRIDGNKNGKTRWSSMGWGGALLFMKTYQQYFFLQKRHPLKAFLLNLICARRIGL